ncbi:MAG: protein kinase [Myxococcales bacterium]|nr:protein kinase [Myxococcales bacterium]
MADTLTGVHLGPFRIESPLGQGGMATVWRALHQERGIPVALKILDRTTEDLAQAFQNEVRAVAKLDHPSVVWVFDVGVVGAQTAASEPRLPEGTPFIAMEHAGRGTLRECSELQWPAVREVLLALLDALAHAHARGVIHLDLKPANVLLCGPEDLRPGLKLADFGIARALGRYNPTLPGKGPAIGTVQYMAPEQIRSQAEAYGPWTDLYGLGNVAWQLVTGRVPFHWLEQPQLVRGQLEQELPALEAEGFPDGFGAWVRRCIAKEPAARFQRAADAADALIALGGGLGTTGVLVRREADDLDDMASTVVGLPAGVELTTDHVTLHNAVRPPQLGGLDRTWVPSNTLSDWRRPNSKRRALQLLGAGLRLYGVRRPPMVGRIDERDALWRQLRRVTQTGRPQLVLVQGPAGCGASRLARWLCERAHEVGAATPLEARFHHSDPPDAAIRRMWATYLQLDAAQPKDRVGWLRTRLGQLGLAESVSELVALVSPADASTRRRASIQVLKAITQERPVVLWLDDVHHGSEGLDLARDLLAAPSVVPVLVVATAQREGVAQRPEVLARLRSLPATGIELGPLSGRDRASLVEEVLGLSPALAAQVAERTGGNPSFAVDLIGDWVRRDLLVPSPTGFTIRQGARPDLPEAMQVRWMTRVDELLADLPARAGWLLARAAVLGLQVELREWAVVCDDPGGDWGAAGRQRRVPEHERLRAEVLKRLSGARLITLDENRFTFSHGMLREALLERAREAGDLAVHHASCAGYLRHASAQATDAGGAELAERIGRHLLGAGRLDDASVYLMEAVSLRRDRSGARAALGLLALAEDALRQLELPRTDARWADVLQWRVDLCAELGETTEAQRLANHLAKNAQGRPEWFPHVWSAQLTMARMRRTVGDLAGAEALLRKVLQSSSDPAQLGVAHAERALLAAHRGDDEVRRTHTDEAIRQLRRAASSRAVAECCQLVGSTALLARNLHQAEEMLGRALKLNERRGNVVGQASCLAGLGRAAAFRHESHVAEERLEEAIHLYELAGSSEVVQPRADLAELRLRVARFEEARELLNAVRLTLGRQRRQGAVAGLDAMHLAAGAGVGDWEDYDHQLGRLGGDASHDDERSRWALELGAALADQAGESWRAEQARALIGRERSSGPSVP